MVRDREYDVTLGTPDSRITYFSANPNGEAEIIKVTLKPNPRVRRIIFEHDFSEVSIKDARHGDNSHPLAGTQNILETERRLYSRWT